MFKYPKFVFEFEKCSSSFFSFFLLIFTCSLFVFKNIVTVLKNVLDFQLRMFLFKIFTTVREMIGIQFFSCIIISFEIQSKFPFSYFSQKFQKMMVLCFCYKNCSQLQKCLLFFHLFSGVAKKFHVPKIVCVSIKSN